MSKEILSKDTLKWAVDPFIDKLKLPSFSNASFESFSLSSTFISTISITSHKNYSLH